MKSEFLSKEEYQEFLAEQRHYYEAMPLKRIARDLISRYGFNEDIPSEIEDTIKKRAEELVKALDDICGFKTRIVETGHNPYYVDFIMDEKHYNYYDFPPDLRWKIDKALENLDERLKETGEIAAETSKMMEAIVGKWEMFVERLVAPGGRRMFRERGIGVTTTSMQVYVQRNGKKEIEINVLVESQEYVLPIKVRCTLNVEEVDEHLKDMQRFKQFFPHFKDRKVIGAVAGIVIDEDADRYAYRKGLFVIGQTGETVKILNDEKFEPKEW